MFVVYDICFFFSPIDWNNFYCKTLDNCTLFCLKTWETNTCLHSHKFEDDRNNSFFRQFILLEHLFFCPNTENCLGLTGWCPWNYLVWIGLNTWHLWSLHTLHNRSLDMTQLVIKHDTVGSFTHDKLVCTHDTAGPCTHDTIVLGHCTIGHCTHNSLFLHTWRKWPLHS